MLDPVAGILDFYRLAERLKRELRHSWLSDGRRESVAEHSWSMSLLALLAHRHLEQPVEIERVLKMIIIHDLVEALAGDVPFFETGDRKLAKAARERDAIAEIRSRLQGGGRAGDLRALARVRGEAHAGGQVRCRARQSRGSDAA